MAPPELHWQTFASPLADGTLKAPTAHLAPLALSARRAIAFRAMLEIDLPHAVVNVGVGMPEARARYTHPVPETLHPSLWKMQLCAATVRLCVPGLACS